MKTPQEIVVECWRGHDHVECVRDYPTIGIACGACLDNTVAALAAAREEGRREGLREAEVLAERLGHYQYLVAKIRALASQPKPEPADPRRGIRIALTDEQRAALTVPEPAVTCEGCELGLERVGIDGVPGWSHRDVSYDVIGSRSVLTPCTAKPEGGKEPGT